MQAMLNLLSNAYKNTREGSITMSIDHVPEIHGIDGKKKMQVTVSDTGKGLRREEESSVFAPHKRIKDPAAAATGHGLGLKTLR